MAQGNYTRHGSTLSANIKTTSANERGLQTGQCGTYRCPLNYFIKFPEALGRQPVSTVKKVLFAAFDEIKRLRKGAK